MTYSKPMVTIELEEYNELKSLASGGLTIAKKITQYFIQSALQAGLLPLTPEVELRTVLQALAKQEKIFIGFPGDIKSIRHLGYNDISIKTES